MRADLADLLYRLPADLREPATKLVADLATKPAQSILEAVYADKLGAFRLMSYVHPYLTVVLPNLILTAAIFFALVALTRQMLPNYVGVNPIPYIGSAYLGPAYEPFAVTGDPNDPKFTVPNIGSLVSTST